jgi:hypothetical protein
VFQGRVHCAGIRGKDLQMMDSKKRWTAFSRVRRLALGATALLWLGAVEALAAGGGKPATKLVNVADTRNLDPGISKWIADIYNASHWQFGFMVIVVMALMGLILGFGCDRLMGLLGLDLGKLQHHE